MPKVVIYEHGNYGGRSQALRPGRYSGDALTLGDNVVSSISVPPGWKVTMWTDAGFAGNSQIVTASTTFVSSNDTMSSITVTAPRDESLEEGTGSLGFLAISGQPTWLNLGTLGIDFGANFRGFTFEAWVWFDSAGFYARIFDFHKTNAVGVDNIILTREGTSSDLRFELRKNSAQNVLIARGVIENGQWMHIAVTIDSAGIGRIYCKGNKVAEGSLGIPANIARDASWVGRSPWTQDLYFAGQMAEIRIWSIARSAEEIKRAMSSRLTGTEAGLYRYYRLDEPSTSGGVLRDLSANNASVTVQGAALYGLAGPKLAAAADAPGGLAFDGVGDYVTLPPVQDDLSNGFTLEAWAYFEDNAAFARILELSNGRNADNIVLARDNNTTGLCLSIYRSGVSGSLTAPGAIVNNTWFHVAVTFGNVSNQMGTAAIYINGALKVSAQIAAPSVGSRQISYLGKSSTSWDPLFKGRLAEVRIWKRVRTLEEIKAARYQRLDPKETGLVAYYPLDEWNSPLAHDVSPSGLDGSLQLDIGWKRPLHVDYVPRLPPAAALVFNGVDTHLQLPTISTDFSAGLTLEAWVCFDGVANWGRIFELSNGPGADNILLARFGLSTELVFVSCRGNVYDGLNAVGVIEDGRWMHVAATLGPIEADGKATATIYVNGVVKATGRLFGQQNLIRTTNYVGKSVYADPLFKGRLAELRIWTRPRSQAEIRAAMNAPLVGDEPGLHLYYPLSETSGTVAYPKLLPLGVPPRLLTSALTFNGTDGFVQLPTISVDFSAGLTLEAWVRFDGVANWGRIFELSNGPGADNIVLARFGLSTELVFLSCRGNVYDGLNAVGVIEDGRWMHVAATLGPIEADGKATATIYVNGVVKATGRLFGQQNLSRTINYIGKSVYADPLFNGRMAELRIWTRARSQAEVINAMNQPLTGNQVGLHLYYPVSESSIATTPLLTASPQGVPPWPVANTMVFNGTNTVCSLPTITVDFRAGLTLEAWVYFDSVAHWSRVFEISNGAISDNIVLARNATTNNLHFSVYTGNSGEGFDAINVIQTGRWMHVAATLGPAEADGKGAAKIYVNGVLRAEGRLRPPANLPRATNYIGKSAWASDALFKGRISEARIWSRVRTQDELRSAMHQAVVGNEAGLCLYRSLADKQALTIQGKVSRQLADTQLPTVGSLGFDGVDDAVQLPTLNVDFSYGYSLEMWLYLDDLEGSSACILELGTASGANRITLRREGSNGDLKFAVYSTSNSCFLVNATGVLESGKWMHLAITSNGAQASVYINGDLRKQSSISTPAYVLRDNVWVGKSSYGSGGLLRGRMADLRIYSYERSQTEIQRSMTTPCLGNEFRLAHHFPLDDFAGNQARDQAQQNATLVGKVDWQALPHRNSLAFNGTNTRVELPLVDSNFTTGVTLEAWVLFTSRDWSTAIIDLAAGFNADNLFLTTETTTNNLRFYTFNGSTGRYIEAVGVIRDGEWMHVAATLEGDFATLYVNGEIKARGLVSTVRNINRPMSYLGDCNFRAAWGYKYLRGRLSEVRIWNRCRTQAEIQTMMYRPLKGSEPGLCRYYPLTDSGNTAIDLVSGVAAPIVNRPTGDTLPLIPDTRSLRFDGRSSFVDIPGHSTALFINANLFAGFTIEAWICPLGTAYGNEVLIAFGGGTQEKSLKLWYDKAITSFRIAYGTAPNLDSYIFPLPRTAGTWMHIAVTVSSSNAVTVYKNGVSTYSGQLSTADKRPIVSELRSRLGMDLDNNSPFQGRMTEVRLWNRARTAAEISAAWATRATGNEIGLVRYYPLTDFWGGIARDGRSHTPATIQGEPRRFTRRLTSSNPMQPTSSGLEFNGTSAHVVLPPIRTNWTPGVTIEAWVYFDGLVKDVRIIELSRDEAIDEISLGLANNTGALFFQVVREAQAQTLTTGNVIVDRTWTHVAATVDAGIPRIYINGVLQVSGNTGNTALDFSTSPAVMRNKSFLGKSSRDVPLFKGRMADVRLWRRARTEQELRGTMSGSIGQDDPALVANYRLDEISGTQARDISTNKFDAEVRGTKSKWGARGPYFIPDPNQPGALTFSGNGDWVELPAFQYAFTDGFTIEAWVNFADSGAYARIIELSNGWNVHSIIVARDNATNNLGLTIKGYAGDGFLAANGVISNGTWMHVAVTLYKDSPFSNTGTATIYINGVLKATGSIVIPYSTSRSFCYLGKSTASWDPLFRGRMADVRIWSFCRTATQINQDKNRRLRGSEYGLLAYYRLNETTGERAGDAGPYQLHGQVRGSANFSLAAPLPTWDGVASSVSTAAWTGYSPPVGPPPAPIANRTPCALTFNGSTTYVQMPAISANFSTGFTIEGTIRADGEKPVGTIFDLGTGTISDNIQVIARSDGRMALRIYINATTYTEVLTKDPWLLQNTWQHFAFTVDAARNVRFKNATVQLTIDGVVGSILPAGRMPRANVTRSSSLLGKNSTSSPAWFKGYLMEVRIWNCARSDNEIATASNLELTGAESGLVALYHLNDTQGQIAHSGVPGLGDATVFNALWGVPPASAPQPLTPATLPSQQVALSPIAPSGALPIVGMSPVDPNTITTATVGYSVGVSTDDGLINTSFNGYVDSGLNFSILGTTAKLSISGSVSIRPMANQIAFVCQPTLRVDNAYDFGFPSTTVTLTRGSSPMIYTVCFAPGTALPLVSLKDMVTKAAKDPLLAATLDAVLVPFLNLLEGCVVLVANRSGSDSTLGSYEEGVNLFVSRKMSELPVLDLVHSALPQLGLQNRSIVLAISLRTTAGYKVSAGALLNIKILNTGPVSLEFNELGIQLSSQATATSIGVVHRFTLILLGETLVFRGGVNIEQTNAGSAVSIWGALDPKNADGTPRADGTTWKNPWGLPGLEIGGFGVQVRGGTVIGIGCRGEIHIGGGLIGGSFGLNLDTANPILFVDSPEGIDLPRLVTAFLSGLPSEAKTAIDALNVALAIRLKDMHLYFAPNGGEIAGKTFDPGVSIGASLDLWGYQAKIFGRLDQNTGAILKGRADRIKVDVGAITLLQFSDLTGQLGPNVDFELTTSRQQIFYSGQLRLLNGVYSSYQELAVGSEGLSFKGGSPLGALAMTLNWQTGLFALTIAPRFVYSFDALGIPVNVDIGGEVAQRVDSAGFQQALKFWFRVCGVGFEVGPVTWGVPLIDIKAIGAVFETFFGDMVKGFFTDTIAGGLKVAYEWVRDNLTNVAEEAIELFKTAGAAVADIAKNVYATFDTTAQEVIGFLGGTINQAADLLRGSLNLLASETAEILGAAYGVGETAVRAALSFAGYAASEISSIASDVWDNINEYVGYLDPTSW